MGESTIGRVQENRNMEEPPRCSTERTKQDRQPWFSTPTS